MSKLRAFLTFGTRPEAIKMAPIVHECQRRSEHIEAIVCVTGQHRELLDQVTDYFGIHPDLDLEIMQPNQKLAEVTSRCIERLDAALEKYQPECVVAQGDTTTVMAAAITAFYRHIPFVHVEAGLRTGNLQAPWPEEFNRRVASLVTTIHCAPTQRSADNLLAEHVPTHSVHVTGNTVIDALLWTVARERKQHSQWQEKYSYLDNRRMVLITGHRRENFGGGIKRICQAITILADTFPDVDFVYPVHLNPNVREPVRRLLADHRNIYLNKPTPYQEFVWLMDRSTLILSDSGGVQEEAPSLRKPLLVMRDTTERPEAIDAGAARLVGTSTEAIVEGVSTLLLDPKKYTACQIDRNPYGDGHAAERIVDLMLQQGDSSG